MLYTDEFIKEANKIPNWRFLVSGGTESTALVLEAHDLIKKGIMTPKTIRLINTNTGLQKPESKKILDELVEYTGWELIILRPFEHILKIFKGFIGEREIEQIRNKLIRMTIKKAFLMLDKVFEDRKNKKYDRKDFECCMVLKEKPGRVYSFSIPKKERINYLIITGIAPYESTQRALRLAYYRNRNLWLNPNQTHGGIIYGRPLRDLYKHSVIKEVLDYYGFSHVRGSGCRICPIVYLFEDLHKKDKKCFIQSKRFLLRECKGLTICSGITDDF